MTLLILILIAIPVCILTILLWIFNDYQKYKKQNCSLLLLFLVLPATMQVLSTDNPQFFNTSNFIITQSY
ncbi:hypothetical protein DXA68_14035 [Bacteroides stercorirosoris]|jgi:hypothetical protein|uniref:Uncharacterized protein n=1 Tax=Bacteroides stercorirosoris TaxID=871324 RepID=A0A1M6J7H9_9BACE|nr:hypothetical protein DXA68_14035 [Bacteroides stercorirosoris]SHJ42659.1 hypothetical protein SAMN05444350_12732 [Bacteroides stercorirosoris]